MRRKDSIVSDRSGPRNPCSLRPYGPGAPSWGAAGSGCRRVLTAGGDEAHAITLVLEPDRSVVEGAPAVLLALVLVGRELNRVNRRRSARPHRRRCALDGDGDRARAEVLNREAGLAVVGHLRGASRGNGHDPEAVGKDDRAVPL